MTEEQLKARANSKQAEPLFIEELVALFQVITDKLHSPGTDPVHLYIHARDLTYFSGDRPSDLSHVKAAEISRFPNDKGILFDHVFGKTLRSGDSRVFAAARHPNTTICPVKALDDYITICPQRPPCSTPLKEMSFFLTLFPDAAEARPKSYLEAAGLSHKTLSSFRCRGAITMALTGNTLDNIVEYVGWKSHRMARHYLQLHKSLQPDSVAARISQATHQRPLPVIANSISFKASNQPFLLPFPALSLYNNASPLESRTFKT